MGKVLKCQPPNLLQDVSCQPVLPRMKLLKLSMESTPPLLTSQTTNTFSWLNTLVNQTAQLLCLRKLQSERLSRSLLERLSLKFCQNHIPDKVMKYLSTVEKNVLPEINQSRSKTSLGKLSLKLYQNP